ncbi:hypothetical protein J4573_51410 [Actinomadura barringtoniae]|uniref:Uncharacterized protein n=1 Tax=Actinomadura barringtoniae TaxID=1427535 RepID=A0A939PMW6_9ACTN|nr:hypothetical protein [Actinomadura barringtoniae]MBO2455565.1 hypothetical protein [Actinomadura barringtoniae]
MSATIAPATNPTTASPISLSASELAQILFTSRLQASGRPSTTQVRAAIDERLAECGDDCATCLASVAQEAGDHPEAYAARMRWALDSVSRAYSSCMAAA